jgi:predicted cupin superfamily sugar epimerase
MRPAVDEIVAQLGLAPHPEGGLFRETYRAKEVVETPRGARPAATAILFLVTADAPSRLHRLASDELWVFQGGLPLELVRLSVFGPANVLLGVPDESGGPEAPAALQPQALVPAGVWQAARVAGRPHPPAERAWSLVSCVVTPGFDEDDFVLGDRDELLALFPDQRELVVALS